MRRAPAAWSDSSSGNYVPAFRGASHFNQRADIPQLSLQAMVELGQVTQLWHQHKGCELLPAVVVGKRGAEESCKSSHRQGGEQPPCGISSH